MSKNTNLRKITNYLTADNNTLSSNVSQTITGSLTVTGNLTAQQFILSSSVTYLTESFASGSHKFGDSSDDNHNFTGSLIVGFGGSTELNVQQTGVNIGNTLTDNHIISGSLRINPNGLFVSSSGFVGIGTTSPSQLLEVVGGEIKAGRVDSNNEGGQVSFGRSTDNNTAWYIDAFGNVASPQLRFVDVTGGVVRMTITGSNVGIGTSAPSTILHISSGTPVLRLTTTTQNTPSGVEFGVLNGGTYNYAKIDVTNVQDYDTNLRFWTAAATSTTLVERMRLTKDGDLLIGNTDGTGKLVIAGDDNVIILRSRNTSAGGSYQFYISHSLGNVSMGNSRGTVAYNNSSDYRLKEDLKPFNGLDILSDINFYDFKWKESQIRNYGIIAHELQEVIPYIVEGNKDELFEDGSIKSQQIDITKLIPILGKAIQELSDKNTTLEEILQRNNIV
jgi:hypothetical protein